MKVLINSGLVIPVFHKRDKLINSILELNHTVIVSGYEKEGEEECKKNGVKFSYIPMSRSGLNPISDLKTLIAYYKLVKKEHIDIVHSYTAKPNIYASIGARLAGAKKIYPTINGLGYAFVNNDIKSKIIRKVICFLYKIAFKCSEKVFFQNSDDAEEMIKRKVIKREKCVIISGSGLDLEKFKYSEITNTDVFLLASRLLITKGIREYFKAAKIVKEKYPHARFLIAGALDTKNPDGISEDELNYYVNDGYIEYLGKIDGNKMPDVIKKCSTFVLPSYYREGIPHAVLEAMGIGRAIITTNMLGCKETVNKKNGFLINPKDSQELVEKMIWIINNPNKVKKMGLESRKYAEERFDVKKVNGDILSTMFKEY